MNDPHIEKPAVTTLPDGWRWAKLGEVCEFNPSRPPNFKRADEAQTSFVPMSAIDEVSGTIARCEVRLFSNVRKGYTFFGEGDVLFAKITPCMQNGKHAVAHDLIDGIGFGTTEFHVLRPKAEVISEWIHWFVRQPGFIQLAKASFTGSAGQQRVPEKFLTAFEIPLPPKPEQKRIAGILREQMAGMERARASAEAQLQAAENLPAAYLRAVFNNSESKSWPKKRLGNIAKTSSGSTPSRGRSDYFGGTIPWVKTGELRDGFILDTEEKVTEKALIECSLPLLPAQTLLVAMYGQGQTRGRTGLLTQPMTTNQACFAVLPNPTIFDSAFLQWWFRHSYARLRLETESRGGNQPNLNGIFLREQVVQLPPLADQRRIAMQLSAQMASAERLRQMLADQLDAINKLPAALLRRAFNGEL